MKSSVFGWLVSYWKFLEYWFLFLKTEVVATVVFHCRFHSFLLFMGHPPYAIREVNINKFCRIISEFALEYRTTRERVLQQKQKRANHRERNKTRGKMITDVSFMKSASFFLLIFIVESITNVPPFVIYFESIINHNMSHSLGTVLFFLLKIILLYNEWGTRMCKLRMCG